jgi:hypothetical protein
VGGTTMIAKQGELKITEHNTSQRSISGTFYFTAESTSGPEMAHITEGKFSATY